MLLLIYNIYQVLVRVLSLSQDILLNDTQEYIDIADEDESGTIDFPEFLTLMSKAGRGCPSAIFNTVLCCAGEQQVKD